MAKISLRNYNRLIENRIQNGQHIEAIAHCRHILRTFPKYLEAYRLLGKASLEAKRYDDAVDIFQRVLMSVPDDFVSNVGLSIIADEQDKLDDAIWHMERAFEVQPSNSAILGELQRLYGRRDGVEPPKIRLTRGALAHMYVQGELYAQAVSEIQDVLATDSQRVDMQVLLAKAYFRMGQKTEATDACSQLLKKYPYCLDANRVLVEILPSTQRAESTQVYRQRIIELEPYTAFVQDSVFQVDQVADAAVSVEQLEYQGKAPVADTGQDWKSGLAIALPTDTAATSASTSEEPDWLKKAMAPASSPTPEPAPASEDSDQIPEFMRQAGWGESTGQAEEKQSTSANQSPEAPPAVQADLPDWVKAMAPVAEEESPESTPAAADIPDWVKQLGGEQSASPAPSESKAVETPQPVEKSQSPVGTAPIEPVAEISQPPEPVQPAAEAASSVAKEEEIPDWLKPPDEAQERLITSDQAQPVSQPPADVKPPAPAPAEPQPVQPDDSLGGLGKSTQEQDDAMAWLESLAAKHGAKPEELVTDPNARTDTAPEWVDKAKSLSEPPSTTEQPVEETSLSSDDQTGVWLRDLEAREAENKIEAPKPEEPEEQTAPTEPELSDWMSGVSDENVSPQTSNEPEEPVAAAAETSNAAPQVNLEDWLASLDKGEEQTHPAAGPSESAEELPAWLANESEPQAAEPTQPDEWHSAGYEAQSENVTPENAPTEESSVPENVVPEPVTKPPAESPASAKTTRREISIEVEQPRPPRRSAPRAPKSRKLESAVSLESAQSEMERGNIGAALDVYVKLIRKGKSLDEIIRDLREALDRYPVEVPLWQALGDAYMRSNRLQEALDAYTKAEELLR